MQLRGATALRHMAFFDVSQTGWFFLLLFVCSVTHGVILDCKQARQGDVDKLNTAAVADTTRDNITSIISAILLCIQQDVLRQLKVKR